MEKNTFYIIKDEFFDIIDDENLKDNKNESRPHYYCMLYKGYFWMIPLSSKTEKYKNIIENRKKNGKKSDILHIAKLDNGKDTVFLIQDIFPIIDKYIEREYMLFGKPMMITSERTIIDIENKAKKIINLKLRGTKLMETQADVNKIIKILSEQNEVKKV